jgi:hypothetical protein
VRRQSLQATFRREPLVERVAAPSDCMDTGAGGEEPANRSQADPASATGDDGNATFKAREVISQRQTAPSNSRRVSCGQAREG